ncbi:hypothetical protein C8R44DRAFT_686402, partial [Mycena epipterygia]
SLSFFLNSGSIAKDGSVTVHEVPDENDPDFQPEVEDDPISVHDSSGDESDATQSQSRSQAEKKNPAKKKQKQVDVVGEDGLLADINVQPIVQPRYQPTHQRTCCISLAKNFASQAVTRVIEPASYASKKDLVADVSIHRRHYAKFHKPKYHAWCETNDFESKLEEDVKARQKADEHKNKLLNQQTIDPHLREKPARPTPSTVCSCCCNSPLTR